MILRIPRAVDMQTLGRRLGQALLQVGPAPQVIALNGDLGAGKTTFVTGVLAGCGIAGSARSPTYTLIEPYEVGDRTLYHLDLYRLSGPEDLEALGIRDLHTPGNSLLVEWAERGEGALPPVDLSLSFRYVDAGDVGSGDSPREVEVTPMSTLGVQIAASLADIDSGLVVGGT